jgi:glutathionyl-hydroquinone reductase
MLYLVTARRERHAAFKCNWRCVVDYPNLLRDLYQVSGIAETIHMDHIKR